MQDLITDLNAESEVLPMQEKNEDWLGHKGMVIIMIKFIINISLQAETRITHTIINLPKDFFLEINKERKNLFQAKTYIPEIDFFSH